MMMKSAVVLLFLQAGVAAQPMSRDAARHRAAALAEIGRVAFQDPALSASGQQSCATCHDPANHFAPDNAQPVQPGGKAMQGHGLRATPALTYLDGQPPFTLHFFESDEEGDESVDAGPTGGLTWDGRVDRARDQALMPLLDPDEMANKDAAALAARLRDRPWFATLRRLFPAGLAAPHEAAAALGEALEAFEQTAEFHPYSSKYDAVLRGAASLSPAEARGQAAFEDPARGNCARCHPDRMSPDGALPHFTDAGFAAAAVPRNPEIAANADPAFFDLGLCGPKRTDLAAHPELCGRFATPSLRNAATRHSFFHNGAMHTLRRAVEFYATRDTDPAAWYPRGADGTVQSYDDLPARDRGNVEQDAPFGRHPGEAPALSPAEIDDIVAFLGALTDGWTP